MDITALIIQIIVGALAGWIAGLVFRGGSLGLIGNVVIGILGSYVGSWVLGKLGLSISLGNPYVTMVVIGAIGAGIILAVINLLVGRR